MALSTGNIVLLAIGAVLLVTGAARTAVYLVPPGPSAQAVYQWSPGQLQGTVAQRADFQSASTRAPFQASSGNTVAPIPNTLHPQVIPDAATQSSTSSPSGRGGDAGSPYQETGIASESAAMPVTEAMAPLGNKFVRIWHWVQETGEFIYYDPLVSEESTLKALASGQTYLILVKESVTLIVNGQQLELNCDDGDCWNKVVWP